MKKLLLITIACCFGFLSYGQDLVITGAFDASLTGGTPKGIELYAASAIPDLSLYGVGSANNGGGTDGVEFIMNGSVSAGEYIYISTEEPNFSSWFGFAPNFVSPSMSINGDDAVELFYDATGAFAGSEAVVDVFGDINKDGSGEAWEYLDSWAYRVDATGPEGSTFTVGNWIFGGPNIWDGESSNNAASSRMPIGTYSSQVSGPITSNWTGSFSADWKDERNWDNGVPSNIDNAVIPDVSAGSGVYPVISATTVAETSDLTINSGASLLVESGGALLISGTATVDGTFTAERSIAGAFGYSAMGSPVAGETFQDLGADFIFGFNGTDYTSNLSSSTSSMSAGVGYLIAEDPETATETTSSVFHSYLEGFDSDLSDYTAFNVIGVDQGWEWVSDNNGAIQMTAFDNTDDDNPNEDWIVSPPIDLSSAVGSSLNLSIESDFAALELEDVLTVKTTLNFTGDVATTNWVDLVVPGFENSNGNGSVTDYVVDISDFDGEQSLYIAFVYDNTLTEGQLTSGDFDGPRIRIDQVSIT
ncbi:MAG: choice-of-anchor J domain-containing protein, partial [Bacteroidota bacterium]